MVISPRIHGILDYLSVAVLVAAAPVLGFDGRPAEITQTLAGSVLVYSAITAYPLGLFKFIPFDAHRVIDIVVGVAMIAAPWLFRFSDVAAARNFFVIFGVGSLLIVALTQFRQMPETTPRR